MNVRLNQSSARETGGGQSLTSTAGTCQGVTTLSRGRRTAPQPIGDATRAALKRLTVDRGLIAVGVVVAAGSILFATLMISRDNSRPTFGGVQHLMIFAQPIGGSRVDRVTAEARSDAAVDYDPTGSVEPRQARGPADIRAQSGAGKAAAPRSAGGYVLRTLVGGELALEGPRGRFPVAPGVALPGLGRVLALQNRNGRWMVKTERGVITESDP